MELVDIFIDSYENFLLVLKNFFYEYEEYYERFKNEGNWL